MKSKWVLSLLLSLGILLYGVLIQIQPLVQAKQVLQIQNQQLKLELKQNKSKPSLIRGESTELYTWLQSSTFQGLQVQALIQNPESLDLELAANSDLMQKVLGELQGSYFTGLNCAIKTGLLVCRIQFIAIQTRALVPDEPSPVSLKEIPKKIENLPKAIGIVHKGGESFCVFTINSKIIFKKAQSC